MEIAERIQALALKIRKQKASIETEEATKNAFVMPFISTRARLYAIAHDGKIRLLVEVKKILDPLKVEHA